MAAYPLMSAPPTEVAPPNPPLANHPSSKVYKALQDLPECKSGFTASESPEEFLPFFGQVDRDSLFTHGVVTR